MRKCIRQQLLSPQHNWNIPPTHTDLYQNCNFYQSFGQLTSIFFSLYLPMALSISRKRLFFLYCPPMFGAAPGRETIFIFCICCINCGRLYIIFFRDGESILKTQRRTRTPVLFKDHWLLNRSVFIAKQTDRRITLHLFTRLTVLLLTFCLLLFWQEEAMRGQSGCWNVKLSLSAPWQKCCIDSHSSNLSFVTCLFVIVVVRQHEIMTLAKWRWKSK